MWLTSSVSTTGGLGLLGLGLALSSAAPANAGWLNSDSLPEVGNVATHISCLHAFRPHALRMSVRHHDDSCRHFNL